MFSPGLPYHVSRGHCPNIPSFNLGDKSEGAIKLNLQGHALMEPVMLTPRQI